MNHFHWGLTFVALMVIGAPIQASARPDQPDCVGRYLLSGDVTPTIHGRSFQFYWGDIKTWRESDSAYARRLNDARKSAERAGTLLKAPVRMDKKMGMLMVTNEEGAPPHDPYASLVIGYAHDTGVTFEVKKRTVNRLLEVAELRTREILESVQPSSPNKPSVGATAFCVGDGVITLAPQKGWHESFRIDGSFNAGRYKYDFLLSVSPVKRQELVAPDLESRRYTMATAVGARKVRNIEKQQGSNGAAQLLSIEDLSGKQFIVYEWRGSAPPDDVSRSPIPHLYIWSSKSNGKASDAHLTAVARANKTEMPIFLSIRSSGKVVGLATSQAKPQVEESKLPYSVQLTDRQTQMLLTNTAYEILIDGKKVYEGRSDKDGYTFTQNIDYLENIEFIRTAEDD